METPRTGKAQRGSALAPHRIHQEARAVDLEQEGRMSQPRHAQPGRRTLSPQPDWVHERKRRRRNAVLAGTDEITDGRTLDAGLESRRHGIRVPEHSAVEPRRREYALATTCVLRATSLHPIRIGEPGADLQAGCRGGVV